jgi:hypothetical protein
MRFIGMPAAWAVERRAASESGMRDRVEFDNDYDNDNDSDNRARGFSDPDEFIRGH